MLKYAKITNEKTGLCSVGVGTDEEFYKSIGMELIDVELSDIDNQYYLSNKCPHKSEEEKQKEITDKEIEKIKKKLDEIDLKSIRAIRENDELYIEKYKIEATNLRQKLRELEGV